jgi:hypothetical protein
MTNVKANSERVRRYVAAYLADADEVEALLSELTRAEMREAMRLLGLGWLS